MITILFAVCLFLCVVGLVLAVMKRDNGKITWFKVGLVLLFSLPALGQSNCNSVVADTAGMLGGKSAEVEQSAGPLINQGADVHVVTINDSHGNLDLMENDIEKSCPSWRNPQGVRKSTLIALVVSKDRKLGIYYGSAWHSALDNHWNRIKQDYMVPHFRDGDYAAGFIATEDQLTRRLEAAKEESLKPAVTQNQIVNQATDYSGLWNVLLSILIIGLGCFVFFIILGIRRNRKKDAADLLTAQQESQIARNDAAQDIARLENKIETKEALGETVPTISKSLLDQCSQSYSRLSNSVSGSPETNGLDISSYRVMKEQYQRISIIIKQALASIDGVSVKQNQDKEPSTTSSASVGGSQSKTSTHSHHSKQSIPSYSGTYNPPPQQAPPVQQPYVPPAPTYVPSSTNVVIVDNNNSYSYRDKDEYRPRHRDPDPEPQTSSGWFGSSSSSSSSDRDSGGGGSSSWTSSDSSSSDSGSSSSLDSGSSDSGGGESSDF